MKQYLSKLKLLLLGLSLLVTSGCLYQSDGQGNLVYGGFEQVPGDYLNQEVLGAFAQIGISPQDLATFKLANSQSLQTAANYALTASRYAIVGAEQAVQPLISSTAIQMIAANPSQQAILEQVLVSCGGLLSVSVMNEERTSAILNSIRAVLSQDSSSSGVAALYLDELYYQYNDARFALYRVCAKASAELEYAKYLKTQVSNNTPTE